MRNYYCAVTPDEDELPLYIEDSAFKLASRLGIKTSTVYNSINNGLSGKISGRKLVKVKF